jgi:hypothetical protein
MARSHANNGRIYRAVITRTYEDGSGTFVLTSGPYDTPQPAKAQITLAVNMAKASHGKYRNPAYAHTAEGHIESADVVWMREGK